MAVIARRTLAKVKSSVLEYRHPEVPNLMGEVERRRYSRRERVESQKLKVQSKEEPGIWVGHGRKAAASRRTSGCGVSARRCWRANGKEVWTKSSRVGDVWNAGGGQADRTSRGFEKACGVREHCFEPGRVVLYVERQARKGTGASAGDEDVGEAPRCIGKRSETPSRL